MASRKSPRSSRFAMASGVGADHFDAVTLEHARFGKLHRQVEPRLAAERRQQGVRASRAMTSSRISGLSGSM